MSQRRSRKERRRCREEREAELRRFDEAMEKLIASLIDPPLSITPPAQRSTRMQDFFRDDPAHGVSTVTLQSLVAGEVLDLSDRTDAEALRTARESLGPLVSLVRFPAGVSLEEAEEVLRSAPLAGMACGAVGALVEEDSSRSVPLRPAPDTPT